MTGYYEHHLGIKKDKICPFKIGTATNSLSTPCNWHNNIEILLVTYGSGMIQYGKDTLPIVPGDIVIVNSGELHRPFSKNGVSYYFIIIDESFCKENGIDTSSIRFEEKIRNESTEALIMEAVARSREYITSSEPLAAARLRSAMLSIIIDIVSKYTKTDDPHTLKSTPSESYVKAVLDYINTNYSQPISLDELASLCGITKYHLAREFKRITGQTVFTYTNFIRCKQAEMLLSEGKTVTEAAFESGFESLSYFSRTYKKLMGTPPSRRN